MMNSQLKKTFVVSALTIAFYLLLKFYAAFNLFTFFRIFTSFGDVAFSLQWIVLPIPGLIIMAYNYFRRTPIWNLEHVTKESFIGLAVGILLQFVMVFEVLYLNLPIVDTLITFFLGLFTIVPSIWFVTFLIVYLYLKVMRPHKIFIRKKRVRHVR